jgi:phosphatidate cytidylyltransferase
VLRWRLLSSLVILALILSLVALDQRQIGPPGIWLAPIFLLVAIFGTEEVISLVRTQKHDPIPWATYIGSLGLALAGCELLIGSLLKPYITISAMVPAATQTSWPILALAIGIILVFAGEMARFTRAGEGSIVNAALAIFAMAYVGGLMCFLAKLRLEDPARGLFAFLSVPVIVKLADTGAYTTGRIFGRHKMTPLLSPGKTWEGAVGGVLFGCLGSWLAFTYLFPAMTGLGPERIPPLPAILLYGLALTAAGMHGDLAESLLKRDMQRKDSSTWLPGLGGILDIIDSVLMAAPVAYVFWHFGWL